MIKLIKIFFVLFFLITTFISCSTNKSPFFPEWMDTGTRKLNAPPQRWVINNSEGISWNCSEENSLPHFDHIEMAGFHSAALISYGVNCDKSLAIQRHMIWPTLRLKPNKTHDHLAYDISDEIRPLIKVNGTAISQYYPQKISITGNLEIDCLTNSPAQVKRISWITPNQPGLLEEWIISNPTQKKINLSVTDPNFLSSTVASKGVQGSYEIAAKTLNSDDFSLNPRESRTIYFYITAATEGNLNFSIDAAFEINSRKMIISDLWSSLVLQTPDPLLNRAFQFAKLRACESIFKTKNGLMHSPGGASYYAALWTNDQCEYVNPLFPFIGYQIGIDQSINCYQLYKPYMNDHYDDLVTSIISEGDDTWNGAGDRGDAAMYCYGAARFALANGDKEEAKKLWPMIQWGLERCKRNINAEGVVTSDSDELEGRFPTGDANLCTSSLYYDALISSAALANELKKNNLASEYEKEAKKIRRAIENYFGHTMNGYKTYRYFKGNKKLRSWICIPLAAGIFERAQETTDALYSKYLWYGDGMLTEAGSKTFWDRSTLYAFRGALYAGETEITMKHLREYSQKRLLGEHVPYPVEAWPEGNQKHLSAESGLYCRIFTEGLFGIRPIGLNKFTMIPRIPKNWDTMSLNQIKAFGKTFNITVKREIKKLKITLLIPKTGKKYEQVVSPGKMVKIELN